MLDWIRKALEVNKIRRTRTRITIHGIENTINITIKIDIFIYISSPASLEHFPARQDLGSVKDCPTSITPRRN
jgi:hypothetical protein